MSHIVVSYVTDGLTSDGNTTYLSIVTSPITIYTVL